MARIAKQQLTQRFVDKAPSKARPYQVGDSALTGFYLRIEPSGTKTYYVRPPGGSPVRIGKHPIIGLGQARHKAGEILRAGPVIKAETFAAFVADHFAAHVNAHQKRPRETLNTLARFGIDDLRLDEIKLAHIETWRTKRANDGLSPKTINRNTAVLRAALQKAVDWDLISDNPLRRLKPLKTDRQPRARYLKPSEEKRLLKALKSSTSSVLKPMAILAMNTGLRRGELTGLKWGDVDMSDRMLVVHGDTAKSSQTRHVPLNQKALDALREHRGEVRPLPNTQVFGDVDIKRAWATALRRAKISDFRFHDLRHHFASRLVMAGQPLNTVRELLGHSTIDMTLRYAHLAPEGLRDAVDVL